MVNPVGTLVEAQEVTIESGQSLSSLVNLGGRIICAVIIPSAWTAAGLSFQASVDGTNFFDVYFESAELAIAGQTNAFIAVEPTPFLGLTKIKVRSGTTGVPVNQAAARVITLITGQPDYK